MSTDLRTRFAAARDLAAPDLWREAGARASSGPRPLPEPESATGPRRAAVVALAFAVFLLAGAFAWSALRPGGGPRIGSGEPPHELMAVLEPSGSMLPTIEVGEAVTVDLDAYTHEAPARGDIIAFTVEAYPGMEFLKRIIGLPGDTVEQIHGVVEVNGVALSEPYAIEDHRSLGPWVVEPGHVFVMGDNRPDSSDSRFPDLGQVPMTDITGKVLLGVTPTDVPEAPVAPIGTP
jgi:signal peptidase I